MSRALKFLSIFSIVIFLTSCGKDNSPNKQTEISQEKANLESKEDVPEIAQKMKAALAGENSELAGKIFGIPVPMNNYYFAKKAVITFGAKWRGTPQTEEELEDLVWQELLYSFESFRREISVNDDEVDEEIKKILKAQKVEFNWKEDSEKFVAWCEETLKLDVLGLRNQMTHLIQLEKLRQEVMDSFEPEVTEDEAYSKFLDEHNTLLVELRRFDDKAEADLLYEQAIKPIEKKAMDELIWRDLLLLQEAKKRGIAADSEETDRIINSLMREKKARFKWKDDAQKFEEWVTENMNMDSAEFLKTMVDIATINVLTQKIFSGVEPDIDSTGKMATFLKDNRSIKKAYGKFFDSHDKDNNLLQFSNIKVARAFYKSINRNPGVWEDRKRREPKEFKQPGFVAVDFLLNMWKFQKEDCYKMLEMKLGKFYPASPIYKGYAVFKVLNIRRADPKKFEEKHDYYIDRVKTIKKYESYKEWKENFKKAANIEVYN